jgi:hypothetical protein
LIDTSSNCSLAGSYVEAAKLAGRGLTTSSTLTALQKAGGAFLFFSSICGFYLTTLQMMEAVDMPFTLPVGDLARFWPKKKRAWSCEGRERSMAAVELLLFSFSPYLTVEYPSPP